jgi:hypothetical protein
MNRCLFLATAIVTIAVLLPLPGKSAGPAQTSNAELRPVWDRTMEARITDIRLSSIGRCVGISADENIVVIDPAGRELWRWDFRKDNHFIIATKIAVSPNCDWVAFLGGQGYHYVWIVHRQGRRISIKTEGTPLTVDISHAGKSVAIGTGAGFLLLYTPEAALQWKLDVLGFLPTQEIAFAEDDSAIMVSSYGQVIVSADGKRRSFTGVWGVGSMRAAKDFKTFVAWGEPPHGPGIGRVSLLDSEGKALWTRVATDPRAIISPAGDRIIVRTFQTPGSPLAFSSDGRSFVLHQGDGFLALDLNESALWKISKSGYPKFASTPDLRSVVVAQENRAEWYSPPPLTGSSGR